MLNRYYSEIEELEQGPHFPIDEESWEEFGSSFFKGFNQRGTFKERHAEKEGTDGKERIDCLREEHLKTECSNGRSWKKPREELAVSEMKQGCIDSGTISSES